MNIKIRQAYNPVLAQEEGAVRKDPGGRMRVALAYPNSYHVGMSNLGFQTMYHRFNMRHDTLCERVFLPTRDLELIHKNAHTPLVSIETQTPIKDFDILAFSCSFENDYINCLKIMDLSGIPLRSEERGDGSPFVIMGGTCTFFNVEPMAPFIDSFLCGEGESIGDEFLDSYKSWVESDGGRDDLFAQLISIEGVYCPQFYDYVYDSRGRICDLIVKGEAQERILPRTEGQIDGFETSTTVFTDFAEFGDMFLIEITRGCPRGCRFCLLSHIYKPFRCRGLSTLLSQVKNGLLHRGRIGLVGASLTDFRPLKELCDGIMALGGKVSLCSLRADNITDPLMETCKRGGVNTITLAPEAGTESLRSFIGKGDLSDDAIMCAVERMTMYGVPNLRLYFMIGLPGETIGDVEAILSLVKRIRHHTLQVSQGRGIRQITISVNSFVPKPLTPLQFYPMEPVGLLNQKMRYIAKGVHSLKGVQCVHDMPKWSFIQGMLAKGDRRVSEIIALALKENGNWYKAIKQVNLSPDFYTRRTLTQAEIPPWTLWLQDRLPIVQKNGNYL